MASPVALPDPEPAPDDALVPGAVVAGVGVAVAAGLAVATAAAEVVVVWGWKASTPAVPATVAQTTMGDRRMGRTPSQKVKDSKWMRRSGTPARSSSDPSRRARASGPHR